MGWGRFKTFIREYLTYQVMNRLQDDLYTKLNYLNDNKIASSLLAASAAPGKIVKVNSDGLMVTDIDGNAATASNGVPTGMIAYWPASGIPDGWLECNGATVSRDAYSELYAVIGDKYGKGDGSTTFNLPELRGEFLRVWSHGRTETVDGETVEIDDDRELGSAQSDEFKHHQHLFVTSPRWANEGGYTEVSTFQSTRNTTSGDGPQGHYRTKDDVYDEDWDDDYGGSGGDETRPRNMALMACIYSGKCSFGITSRQSTALITASFTISENSEGDLVCQVKEAS
jgi:microcystin-dependent protein